MIFEEMTSNYTFFFFFLSFPGDGSHEEIDRECAIRGKTISLYNVSILVAIGFCYYYNYNYKAIPLDTSQLFRWQFVDLGNYIY